MMISKSEIYLDSQSGKLTEELKKAYLAGQNIVYVVTKDYAVVKDSIKNNPIFFIQSKSITKVSGTNTSSGGTKVEENKTVVTQNIYFGIDSLKEITPQVPSLYIVTNKSFQQSDQLPCHLNAYLKSYVDKLAGMTSDTNPNIKKSMIIIVTPTMIDIPMEISLYSRIVFVKEPSYNEIRNKITELVKTLDGIDLSTQASRDDYLNHISNLAKGLSLHKISQIFCRIKSELDRVFIRVTDNEKFAELENIIREEKSKLIESSAILKLVKTKKNTQVSGGMKMLSHWLAKRKNTILKPEDSMAEAFISQPKGILLAGIPGTGKSLAAKTTSLELGNLPLLQLDMGNIMDKFQGESEHKMEEALNLAEAMSPCILWIDEIEKGIAGASNSSGNSESMKRIFGKLLTWMQEKEERGVCCFVFATANSIDNIPPELFRSGRFDEKFYTFLPTSSECVEIFKNNIHAQNKAYERYCKQNLLTYRPLFDPNILSNSYFEGILSSEYVLKEKLKDDGTPLTKENKFMTGSDIDAIIQRAKLELYHDHKTSKNSTESIYGAGEFREALILALKETRTYGQTNARQIAECYAQLAEYNFIPVSGNEVAPFRFIETSPEEEVAPFDLKSEESINHCNELKSEYDKQLFLFVGLAVNKYLTKKKKEK